MTSGRHTRWSWIVAGLIVAGAMIGGAFITRAQAHVTPPSISFEGRVGAVTASIQLVI